MTMVTRANFIFVLDMSLDMPKTFKNRPEVRAFLAKQKRDYRAKKKREGETKPNELVQN